MRRDYYEPEWLEETPQHIPEEEKKKIRLFKESLWMAYWETGCPFGASPEGFHLWIAFGTETTTN